MQFHQARHQEHSPMGPAKMDTSNPGFPKTSAGCRGKTSRRLTEGSMLGSFIFMGVFVFTGGFSLLLEY